jgi:polysaccharide biosynthesis protein PslG
MSRIALRTTLLGAAAALVIAAPSQAVVATSAATPAKSDRPIIGIGDQKADMFADSRFLDIGITHARINIGWDEMYFLPNADRLRDWMEAAHNAGVAPLVTFGHSWQPRRRRVLPTVDQFVTAFVRFRLLYPWVRDFAVWNEANHCGEPTCHKPGLVADYYDALHAECPSCRILAAELLDLKNMGAWVRQFNRRLGYQAKYWGLHNYLDANRLRTRATSELLSLTKGQIWLTETGGIVARRNRSEIAPKFEESTRHAAVAIRWLFDRLVPLSKRITRVYLYNWNAASKKDTWDSALIGPNGNARPAFRVLQRVLAKGVNRNSFSSGRSSR